MSWPTDLSYGKKREQEFVNALPFLGLKALEGTKADFIDKNGVKWELKSERRTAAQTPNIAVEVESSFAKKGAIFNAVQNECQFIAYYFSCGTVYIYNASSLLVIARCFRRKFGSFKVNNSSASVVLLRRDMLRKAGIECLITS